MKEANTGQTQGHYKGGPLNLQGGNAFAKKNYPTVVDANRKRKLTPTEISDRRAQRLSYFYDEKYVLGHKCRAKRHVYSIELEEVERNVINDVAEMTLEEQETETLVRYLIKNCKISLQSLNDIKRLQDLDN